MLKWLKIAQEWLHWQTACTLVKIRLYLPKASAILEKTLMVFRNLHFDISLFNSHDPLNLGMTEYLKTLSRTMKNYVKEIKKLSFVGESMAQQMKEGFQDRVSSDPNLSAIFVTARSIADILCDLSQSQDILALTLEQSFCEPLGMRIFGQVKNTIKSNFLFFRIP